MGPWALIILLVVVVGADVAFTTRYSRNLPLLGYAFVVGIGAALGIGVEGPLEAALLGLWP